MSITKSVFFSIFLLLVVNTGYADEKVYKWQGEENDINFSDVKPLILDVERVTIKTTISPEQAEKNLQSILDKANGEITPQAEQIPLTDEEKQARDEVIKNNCETARKNLATLNANPRLVTEGENGEKKYWNAEERASKIEATQKQIDYYCR